MRFAPLMALVVATGCLFSNGEDRLTVTVNFQIVEPEATPTAPVIQVISSVIQVTHRFQTPTPCWSFGSKATQDGAVVEFLLTRVLDQTGGCAGGVTDWAYTALISGIKPGATTIAITIDDGTTRDRHQYPLPAPTQ